MIKNLHEGIKFHIKKDTYKKTKKKVYQSCRITTKGKTSLFDRSKLWL